MRRLTIILSFLYSLTSFCQNNIVKSKIELENDFIETITDTLTIPLPAEDRYHKIAENLYMANGGYYMIDDVRCETYATKQNGQLIPLMSWSFPEESVRTILTTPSVCGNIVLNITHLKYGFESCTYKVNLKSLLSSCIHYGCIPYVGISNISDTEVEASLFLVNSKEEYNHVLKLCIPKNVINRKKGTVSGTLHTYIPMGNIENLYEK